MEKIRRERQAPEVDGGEDGVDGCEEKGDGAAAATAGAAKCSPAFGVPE